MKIAIELESCEQCWHFDHTGRIDHGGARPQCSKNGQVIPHGEPAGPGMVRKTLRIPDWCPLRKFQVPDHGMAEY